MSLVKIHVYCNVSKPQATPHSVQISLHHSIYSINGKSPLNIPLSNNSNNCSNLTANC